MSEQIAHAQQQRPERERIEGSVRTVTVAANPDIDENRGMVRILGITTIVRDALIASSLMFVMIPDDAYACAYPDCEAPRVTWSIAPFPSNIPAVPLNPGWVDFQHTVVDLNDAGLSLRNSAGNLMPLQIEADPNVVGGLLLRTEFAPNETYHLRYIDPCADILPDSADGGQTVSSADAGVVELPLYTTSPLPNPSEMGTFQVVVTELRRVDAKTGCGTCTRKVAASAATLLLVPSEELIPYLPFSMFELLVDGEVWTRSGYGELQSDGGLVDRGLFIGWRFMVPERRVNEVFSACGPAPTEFGEDRGVSAGRHAVQLRAVVPGVLDATTSVVEIDLNCDGWDAVGDQVCRGRDDQPDSGQPDAGGIAEPEPEPGCGGCATAPGAGLATMLLASAATRRRRRLVQ